MKKEFSAPSIETAVLSQSEDVMFGIMLTSAGQNPEGFAIFEDEVVEEYKQWKGFTE